MLLMRLYLFFWFAITFLQSCRVPTFNHTILTVGNRNNHSGFSVKTKGGCINGDSLNVFFIESDDPVLSLHSFAITDQPLLERILFVDTNTESVEANAFFNLPNLKRISIQDNKLTVIPTGVFKNMPLEKISLRNNLIRYVDVGSFENLPRLLEVDLSLNNLQEWDAGWFKGSNNLEILALDSNNIKILKNYAFKDLPNIKNISIGHNEMETLEERAFHGLYGLESVDICGNKIKYLHNNTFQGFKRLEFLSLNGNHLMFLSDQLLYDLQNLETLHIHDNPWRCGCYSKIIQFASRYRWKVNVNLRHCYNKNITSPVCVGSVSPIIKCIETFDEVAFNNYIENVDRRIWFSCPKEINQGSFSLVGPPLAIYPNGTQFVNYPYI